MYFISGEIVSACHSNQDLVSDYLFYMESVKALVIVLDALYEEEKNTLT